MERETALEREQLKLEVVQQYYIENLSQQEIAKRCGISRSFVSKLLIEARNQKLVEIKINKPYLIESDRERLLREKFRLKRVIIVSSDTDGDPDVQTVVLERLGTALNDYLNNILKDGDTIGVAWGKTLHRCSRMLKAFKPYQRLTVVQLCGGISLIERSTYASEITTNYAKAFGAKPYVLPLPAIVENGGFREAFQKEQSIKYVMQLIEAVNIAVFTVGRFGAESSLVRSGYISPEEAARLTLQGAVGDICTHLIDEHGKCCSQELEDRLNAVSLDRLKRFDYRIAVVTGAERVSTLRAVLEAQYPNVMIIDDVIANTLMSEQRISIH